MTITDATDVFRLQLTEEVVQEVVEEEVKKVSAEALREARNRLIQAKMEEERLKEEQQTACEEVVTNMVVEIIQEVAVEEIEVVMKRKELHRHLAMAECVMENIMESALEMLVSDTATEILNSLEEERELKIKSQVERLSRRRLLRSFKEWRRLASRGSRQRNAVKTLSI